MLSVYEYFISFTLAFIVAFSATPVAKILAFKVGAVDIPKDERRMHKEPIARLGGFAIIAGFFVSILFSVLSSNLLNTTSAIVFNTQFYGLMAGSIIIAVLGIIDDIKALSAKLKFPIQIVAALIVAFTGTRIEFVTNPFSEIGISTFGPWISYPITVLWIVGITNAINFIDGLDGLAAGVSSIASLSLFFVSVIRDDPNIHTAVLAAMLAGSTLGFLPYNFNPAKIFMGDTGATFLGFALGTISIQGTYKSYTAIAIAVPLLVLALPLFDTIFAILRRVASGKSPMEADRGHLHHRLVDIGLSQKQSVGVIYVASAALGLCAVVLDYKGPMSAIILVIAIAIFIVGGSLYMSEMNNANKVKECHHLQNPSRVALIGGKKLDKLKVMTIFGTRPDAVKMAPLVKELEKCDKIDSVVCVTAQHREMLDQVLKIFDITPQHDLNIMQSRQTLTGITTRALEGLEKVLEQEKPNIVLVHGDTTTCFVGSLAAFYKQIAVGHVEAGLRTYDKYSPYPEEMNRKLTGAMADIHLSPTKTNKENLLKEGVKEEAIYITGNTVNDALRTTVKYDYTFECKELRNIDFANKRIIAVTAHRRENLGEPLHNICRALAAIVDKYQDVEVVYSVHLNPVVQETAREVLGGMERVHLVPPLDVQDMHNLMAKSYMIMTDSGGIQEEAPTLGKPVLVLRKETERPEAVKAGTVRLAGTVEEEIIEHASKLLDDKEDYDKMARSVNPYGDGYASERIVKVLLYHFGLTDEIPEEFKV
ncbi:MAG: UDP-N-acetylglucosamine 2-epimerase [Sporomusa sp.]|jgi:UDP-GlcNAc:undecaprenyl-phosphate GlcNAc-1-phosphate transferase|nr:UDP-N-acetylglucosamine 2-epimerase [Sporomusa sp.]